MNYLEWNNAIIKHYFNSENEEKEVMLYFSEAIIEEIGLNNFQIPDEGYVENFYKALRYGVNGIPNENYIDRIIKLQEKYLSGCRNVAGVEFNYPPYLTYILTFMLPFTSENEIEKCNINNFHQPAKEFFEKKNLTNNYSKLIENKIKLIESYWGKINNWLVEENNFSIGYLEEINPSGNRKYVGKYEYHVLFGRKQEERLTTVFDKNEVLPGELLNEETVRKLLVQNHSFLRLSTNTKDKIQNTNDYIGGKIVKRALTFYNNWDGTNYTTDENRGFSRNNLVLCADFNRLDSKISLTHFRISSSNIPDHLDLLNGDGISIGEKVNQANQHYSSPIKNCFKDLETDVQLIDNANRFKYNWRKKDLYLFKWRDRGLISYSIIGGKIYYKKADITEMLKKNYVRAFKKD
jgi:hypothetical protein